MKIPIWQSFAKTPKPYELSTLSVVMLAEATADRGNKRVHSLDIEKENIPLPKRKRFHK